MEPLIPLIFTALVTAILTGAVAYAFWLKRSDKQTLDTLVTRVTVLEQKSLSEPRVREIISEETRELKAEIHGLKSNILSLPSNLGISIFMIKRLGGYSSIKDKASEGSIKPLTFGVKDSAAEHIQFK